MIEKFKELEGYLYFNTETQQFSMTIAVKIQIGSLES